MATESRKFKITDNQSSISVPHLLKCEGVSVGTTIIPETETIMVRSLMDMDKATGKPAHSETKRNWSFSDGVLTHLTRHFPTNSTVTVTGQWDWDAIQAEDNATRAPLREQVVKV